MKTRPVVVLLMEEFTPDYVIVRSVRGKGHEGTYGPGVSW
jgi:hypothetical protein